MKHQAVVDHILKRLDELAVKYAAYPGNDEPARKKVRNGLLTEAAESAKSWKDGGLIFDWRLKQDQDGAFFIAYYLYVCFSGIDETHRFDFGITANGLPASSHLMTAPSFPGFTW